MKRFLVTVLFSLNLLGMAFGQETVEKSTQKYGIMVDLYPMINGITSGGIGLGFLYENYLNQYFSVVGEINFYTNFDKTIAYNILAHGRLYPLKTSIEKLYTDIGIGYRRRKSDYDGSTDDIHSLIGIAKVGWKFKIGNNFFFESGLGVRYNIYVFNGKENYNFGFNIPLVAGLTF
jgi:hypothetical protein